MHRIIHYRYSPDFVKIITKQKVLKAINVFTMSVLVFNMSFGMTLVSILLPIKGVSASTSLEECKICEENDNGEAGQVTYLKLQYNGITSGTVKVVQNNDDVIYEDTVDPGSFFDFVGTYTKNGMGPEIEIYVDGTLNTEIHTSCSEDLDVHSFWGDFEVIAGSSKESSGICDGGPRCGDGTVDEGEDCDDGNLTDGDGCSATCTQENNSITIKAYKVVCEDESYLPDWGLQGVQDGEPARITPQVVQQFVTDNDPHCWYEADWDFQWGYNGEVNKMDGDYIGPASGEWKDFTTSTGAPDVPAEVIVDDMKDVSKLWFRENLKEGYVPFVNPPGDIQDAGYTAEFYCDLDTLNFDNFEWIDNPQMGNIYYCLAINALIPEPTCGDGNLDEDLGEECDDGNLVDGDGCDANCANEDYCELELIKTADRDPVGPGQRLNYTLTLTNTGTANCTGSGVLLEEKYDPFTEYVTAWPFPSIGNNIWNFGVIIPGASTTIKIEMKVSSDTACDSTIVNEACVWAAEFGDENDPNTWQCVTESTSVICPPECGDGVKDPGEECDGTDGVTPPYQTCNDDCTLNYLPYCGDGKVNQTWEECEGTINVGPHQECVECKLKDLTYCGDNVLQTPNDEKTGGPENNGYEQCDGTDGVGTGEECNENCVLEYCGDGIKNRAEEQCDGTDGVGDGETCSNTCELLWCGDGRASTDLGEVCDDGVNNGVPCTPAYGGTCIYCTSICREVEIRGPYCGDGVKNGLEICDYMDPNETGVPDHYQCKTDCTLEYVPYCGDGIKDEGEDCDDGNDNNWDGCSKNCTNECILDINKTDNLTEADKGSNITYHITLKNIGTADCTGDGVQVEEFYDSKLEYLGLVTPLNPYFGNHLWNFGILTPGQEKTLDITMKIKDTATCGSVIDNKVCAWAEQFGDRSLPGNWICTHDETTVICPPICGDGVKNGDEECDYNDPSKEGVGPHQTCNYLCTLDDLTYCGDGIWQYPNTEGSGGINNDGYEQCDINDNVGEHQSCNDDCTIQNLPWCGDGIRNNGEECDYMDSNEDGVGAHQVCTVNCTVEDEPWCGDGIKNQPTEECDGSDGIIPGVTYCLDNCTKEDVDQGWIKACKWLDKDGDESTTDDQEPVSGWEIIVTNSAGHPVKKNTSDSGCVVFSNLIQGEYTVSETLQNGWTVVYPTSGEFTQILVVDGQETPVDFYNTTKGEIEICKYYDNGQIGIFETATDTPLGWTFQVEDANATVIAEVSTNVEQACVTVNNLNLGDYKVKEVPITGGYWINSYPANGEYDVTLTQNNLSPSVTFLNYQNPPECGNNIIEYPEECDGTATYRDNYECTEDCTWKYIPYCGDGIVDPGEECDGSDGCRPDCTKGGGGGPICGDGIKYWDEECDDGNTNDNDGCSNKCKLPYCGDGIVNNGEECDGSSGCRSDCTKGGTPGGPYCGDGNVNTHLGEECDDGNRVNGDGCSTSCKTENPYCGDGVKTSEEECDDGNNEDGDGCNASCIIVKGEEGKPVLELVKEIIEEKDFYNRGDKKIRYSVTIKNTGNLTAFNVILTDILQEGLLYKDFDGNTKTWEIGDLKEGESKQFTYLVNVAKDAEAGMHVNVVKAIADNHDEVRDDEDLQVITIEVLSEELPETGFSAYEFIVLLTILIGLTGASSLLKKKYENR